MSLSNKNILLVISGGIAAYKALELIRLLKKANATIRCILTKSGEEFVTPLAVSALSENQVYTDIFSLKDETEMGHIRLSREADLIVVAPATANILAKMAHGLADDLASTTLLASNAPIIVAPAMNHMMWDNPATKENIKTLKGRGINFVEPEIGMMACGEEGQGRLAEPEAILNTIQAKISTNNKPLKGKKAIVTSGPTYEPIDPVRFIGNYSSGKQGIAIANLLMMAGAETTLIIGPSSEPIPSGLNTIRVTTAQEMLDACNHNLPCDIAVCAAAVSDWTPKQIKTNKIKKQPNEKPPTIELKENPDILHTISNLGNKRPSLVIGFAAETEDILNKAEEKLKRKNCDWIIANDVSAGTEVFGGDFNTIHILKCKKDKKVTIESLPKLHKTEVAEKLIDNIIQHLNY